MPPHYAPFRWIFTSGSYTAAYRRALNSFRAVQERNRHFARCICVFTAASKSSARRPAGECGLGARCLTGASAPARDGGSGSYFCGRVRGRDLLHHLADGLTQLAGGVALLLEQILLGLRQVRPVGAVDRRLLIEPVATVEDDVVLPAVVLRAEPQALGGFSKGLSEIRAMDLSRGSGAPASSRRAPSSDPRCSSRCRSSS
jgi:hypothetical protein